MNALAALVRKDLILYFSNRRALLITLAAPIAIAAFFGSLFGNSGGERGTIPIVIVDLDQSATSKKIVDAMRAESTLDVQPLDATQAADAVRRGKVRAVVTFPAQFGATAPRALFSSREKPVIDVQYDPSQSITLQVVQGLLTKHVMQGVIGSAFGNDPAGADLTGDLRADVEQNKTLSGASRDDLIQLFESIDRVRRQPVDPAGGTNTGPSLQLPYTVRETASKSDAHADYNSYSHSFAGMGVQFILFMGIDLGIKLLTMRRMGLWQRLRAAPLSRGFLLASQIASGALIAALLFALIFAAGALFFGVRVEGSMTGFILLIGAFALMTAAFGLCIAALGKTPEATRGLAIFATLLMVMLGGAWVPSFVFPQWLQTVSLVMPTRWAVDGFDAMTWRGLGFDAAALPIVVLLGFALFFGAVANWRFDWNER